MLYPTIIYIYNENNISMKCDHVNKRIDGDLQTFETETFVGGSKCLGFRFHRTFVICFITSFITNGPNDEYLTILLFFPYISCLR